MYFQDFTGVSVTLLLNQRRFYEKRSHLDTSFTAQKMKFFKVSGKLPPGKFPPIKLPS